MLQICSKIYISILLLFCTLLTYTWIQPPYLSVQNEATTEPTVAEVKEPDPDPEIDLEPDPDLEAAMTGDEVRRKLLRGPQTKRVHRGTFIIYLLAYACDVQVMMAAWYPWDRVGASLC
jgi:hypothetical protein